MDKGGMYGWNSMVYVHCTYLYVSTYNMEILEMGQVMA